MVTNPNTLEHFETNIEAITQVVHARAAWFIWSRANLNALMGIAKPGHMGVDGARRICTRLSTPHGGSPSAAP
jgi:glycine cleavage system protein P-like pyridoxal-binding family